MEKEGGTRWRADVPRVARALSRVCEELFAGDNGVLVKLKELVCVGETAFGGREKLLSREFDEQFRGAAGFVDGVRCRVGAQLVRRRQSAGVGGGVFDGGSVYVRETRAAKTRASRRNPREVVFLFHLGFWGVCVCVRPRPIK